jgi:hypothetical protein
VTRSLGAIGIGLVILARSLHAGETRSDDAYVRDEGQTWTVGCATAERVIALEDGKLVLKSCRNRVTAHEWIPVGAASPQIVDPSEQVAGPGSAAIPWKLVRASTTKLPQGELQLDLLLQRGALVATKSYVVYPQSSIVREWITFANAGDSPLRIVEPRFLNVCIGVEDVGALDFNWMSGGENQPGSWLLQTEKLHPGKPRTFDSYEPFPLSGPVPGDGIDAEILLNDRQVWPEKGWQHVANATVKVAFDVKLELAAGDRLTFLANMHGNIAYDTTAFDPTIRYADGQTHVASQEFSGEQGRAGWRYGYVENGHFVALVYYPAPKQWRKAKDNPTGTPFVGVGNQHPGAGQDAARVWTAPQAGAVRVTGFVCNTGNQRPGTYGARMGSGSYAPWYALYNRTAGNGLFIGWDYFGHWASSFQPGADGAVTAQLHVAGHQQTLKPGESLTTPKAFVGLYADDLDNAGNELLDWQYRYLWDYTREGWFPAIRMLGYWMKGTGWGQPGVGWTGGQPDPVSTFRKVFRVADLMRYIGADVYHRDWGWWDRAGDWNGPDFRATGDYLRKHGMGQLIYAFLYTVDPQSKVARAHPDWVLGGTTLDMSRPEVVAFMQGQLDTFVERWGDFEWRNDSTPTCPKGGDDTPLLGQDAGLRAVIRGFLDKYPGCAFQAVNGGGNDGGYDYVRYASSFSFSDGAVGILRNYWASLLFPPDKTSDIPDVWNPKDYNQATWRGLLCFNFDMTGDTWDPAKLEGLRELVDIYHYLQKQGVVGRWVRVYRPVIMGDDPTMYLERLSRDRKRGIIIPKRPAPGPVTIKPKGLLPGETYVVSYHEAEAAQERLGADLLERGVAIQKMAPGELVYLNLPLHPGSRLDKQAPTPPGGLARRAADNMGYPGVELSWSPAGDDNWVSYYEVSRDGVALDKVAKGTFYFDHSAGADLAAEYAVRTVDGAGNRSGLVSTGGTPAAAARVIDAAASAGLAFNGSWQHQVGLQPAHAGTLSSSNQKDSAAELIFEGCRVLWFSKLGPDCGKAAVSIDGGEPVEIDTYSADDIWGVCVFRREFDALAPHRISIRVSGERQPRATDSFVHIDGIRVEGRGG